MSPGVDVLVVGGGPAGAATAARLARRGLEVVVLEKARFPREKPCAEFYSPGAVDCLRRLGALEAIRAADAAWPRGMRVATARASFLLSYAEAPALGLPRPVLDRIILDLAAAAGARVREGWRVAGVLVDEGRVVGVRADGPDGPTTLAARVVVGADGTHSAVARSLGARRGARWPRRLGLVARYAGAAGLAGIGEMRVGHGRYCGIAPVGPDLVNVGLVVPLGVRPKGQTLEAFHAEQLALIPGAGDLLRGARRVTPIRGIGPLARRVARAAGPGYLLVGDAAGFLDPFTGEGVYRALRGAELAADAIERAFERGDEPAPAYLAVRRRAFRDKGLVCWLVQLFLASRPGFDYVVGNLAARPEVARALAGVLGDREPAGSALRPGFLWSLLGPGRAGQTVGRAPCAPTTPS